MLGSFLLGVMSRIVAGDVFAGGRAGDMCWILLGGGRVWDCRRGHFC